MMNEPQMDNIGSVGHATLAFGVLFSTLGAVADVEDWLDDNCTGDWSLQVEGMDDTLTKKSLRIMFELEADKLTFINDFARA